ncbi:MAG TPA: hypothetical protein VGX50_11830 [Longimicrobium sp.]|nr:hypothetical protein [Longimicrobium sp.]
MPTMLRKTRNTLLGLAVLGALGFGTSAALAEPLRVPTCTDPEADTACSTSVGCSSYCYRLYGRGPSYCASNDCCYCLS